MHEYNIILYIFCFNRFSECFLGRVKLPMYNYMMIIIYTHILLLKLINNYEHPDFRFETKFAVRSKM
jgi:hypothetical protein